MSLRDSGRVHENRVANGGLRWSVSNGQQSLEVTSSKPQNAQDLEYKRASAVAQLETLMSASKIVIADLVPSTDPRGISLR